MPKQNLTHNVEGSAHVIQHSGSNSSNVVGEGNVIITREKK